MSAETPCPSYCERCGKPLTAEENEACELLCKDCFYAKD